MPVRRSRLSAAISICVLAFGQSVPAAKPPVTAIAFAPNGKSVVVGSQAGIQVRSWPALKIERSLETKLLHVHDLAFSEDGTRLAAAGGVPAEAGSVEVFSWPAGKLLFRSDCHADLIYCVAWHSRSQKIATASLDRVCKILDANTGKPIRSIEGHSRGVTAVCFLGEQKTLVTAGIDQSVRVWETETGRAVRGLNNHTQAVHDLAVRPNRENGMLPMLVSVSSDRTVRLWQPTIGRMMRFARLKSVPLAAAWSANGRHVVVSCRDGRIRVIDPDTVEVLHNLCAVDGWAYSLAVHPTNAGVLVGGRDGQLARVTIPAAAD